MERGRGRRDLEPPPPGDGGGRRQLEPHAAFGGYRQSGLGREGGRPAIEAYTEIKTVLLPFTDEMM